MDRDGRDQSAVQGESFWVRQLTAPSARDHEALAEVFDQYRVHYGETAAVEQSARWLEDNLGAGRVRVFVAEDRSGLVGFATTMQVPASLRLSHFWQVRNISSYRSAVASASVGPFSMPFELRLRHPARCAWSCRPRTRTIPRSLSTPRLASWRSLAIVADAVLDYAGSVADVGDAAGVVELGLGVPGYDEDRHGAARRIFWAVSPRNTRRNGPAVPDPQTRSSSGSESTAAMACSKSSPSAISR